jgi:DNA-binding LacI/PurR family transcriptional regulator
MAVSIKDVALRAGVSTATVSHVLNGTRPASQETRNRVLGVVQELGYSQNQAARNLARGKSSFLGLIISDVRNPFFPEITAAFQDRALAHGMDALVLNTNYDPHSTLHSVSRLIGLQVPGVAILTSQIDPGIANILAERNIAAVYLDLGRVGPHISNLILEYEHGIIEAVEYLSSLGHRSVAYIGGPPHLPSAERRRRAFVETAARLGIEASHVVDSDFTAKGGYLAAAHLFDSNTPSAVVAGNDLTAIGVLHCAYDRGIAVPDDMSVIGFDDIIFAEYTQPALTTVTVPRREIGEMAFEALWAMMSDPACSGREFRISTKLTIRQSARAPKDRAPHFGTEARLGKTPPPELIDL